jgi:hypothetical protein
VIAVAFGNGVHETVAVWNDVLVVTRRVLIQ